MITSEALILVAWFTVMGGVIGSFLNVVVYRLPKGMSLIEPPSHCPKCKKPIRWYWNVPVIGWFMLRGKCRDCGQRISPRYPLVEFIVALMFGLLTTVEFALEGWNLPLRLEFLNDLLALTKSNTQTYYLTLIYHLLLLCVLLIGALIEFDRNRPPVRLYGVTILCGLIFPFQWTFLHPVKAWADEPMLFAAGIDGLCGLAVGGILGYIAWKIQGTVKPGGFPLGIACVGTFLGWQAVFPVALVSSVVGLVVTAVFSGKKQQPLLPLSLWLFLFTFVGILFWAPLARLAGIP